MYTKVGSFDAKAKLSQILREVQQGQRYTITLRGRAVADLVPSGTSQASDVRAAVDAMRALPKVSGVSSQSLAGWVAEGRR